MESRATDIRQRSRKKIWLRNFCIGGFRVIKEEGFRNQQHLLDAPGQ